MWGFVDWSSLNANAARISSDMLLQYMWLPCLNQNWAHELNKVNKPEIANSTQPWGTTGEVYCHLAPCTKRYIRRREYHTQEGSVHLTEVSHRPKTVYSRPNKCEKIQKQLVVVVRVGVVFRHKLFPKSVLKGCSEQNNKPRPFFAQSGG